MHNGAPLRSLNLAYTFPYPPRSGYDLRVWNIVRFLSRRMRQTILCRNPDPVSEDYATTLRKRDIALHSLHLGKPGLVRKLLKGIAFASGAYPVMAAGWYFTDLRRRLERLIWENRYDLIVMEGIWLSAYWPVIQRSGAMRVVNHFDLESLRMTRQARFCADPLQRWFLTREARRMRRLEERVMASADLIWVTSETDRQGLLERNPHWPVFVAPNGVDSEMVRPLPPPASDRELLFVGSYDNSPNVDAVRYFADQVLPLIRQARPEVVFRIVGRHPTPPVLALKEVPGVEVTGPVEDLSTVYAACSVMVAPIRFGGGTRLKILEAMAFGRPVVSTRLGAEGLDMEHGRELMLADTPAEMAAATLDVLARPEFARGLAERARKRVEEAYDWAAIADRMHDRYRELADKRP